jgi:hypothetical protein
MSSIVWKMIATMDKKRKPKASLVASLSKVTSSICLERALKDMTQVSSSNEKRRRCRDYESFCFEIKASLIDR